MGGLGTYPLPLSVMGVAINEFDPVQRFDAKKLGTIHILRHHIFETFGPPHPLRQHVFSTKNKKKLAFSDPPSPPTSTDVIYEWSENNVKIKITGFP